MGQYVGARYVPDVTGNTYDPTQAYENLVVVDNGMGTSYISRKPVPPGIPLTNTEYWAIYGTSNGAIINLQHQIDDINDVLIPTFIDVATLKTYDGASGETVKTRSFYSLNEGGGATYVIGDTATYGNNYMSIPLDNGKYANLVIEDYTVYLDTIGGSSDPNVDNGAIINLIVNDAAFYKYKLVLGDKKYYCTTTIQDTQSVDIIGCYVNTYNTDYNHNKSQLSFTAVSVNNTAIIFNNNGAIKGVVIRGDFVTCTENRALIGSTPGTPYRDWITFAETLANTIGIDCRNSLDNYTVTIEDCCIDGFTRGIYTSYWSKTSNCVFARISNQAIIMDNDSMVTNCRFVQCRVAIITANLSVINSIRGDSIKESMIKVLGTSNVISNIQGDYCGRNVIEMGGTANGTNLNNIAGRYGIDYVGVNMDNLSGDDLGYNALISGTNTRGAVLTGIDGRFRQLDDQRPLTGVILSFYYVNRTAAIMSSNENNRLSGAELKKYVWNQNSCNYSVTIGKYNYIYSNSSAADSNVQTPTLEAVS